MVVVVDGGAQEEEEGHTSLNWNKQQSVATRDHCRHLPFSSVHTLCRYAYRPTGISKICYLDFNITDFVDWVWLVYQLLGIWARRHSTEWFSCTET